MSVAAGSSSSSSGVGPPACDAAVESEAADAFADGLMGLLTPLVSKCDEGVQQALDSQAALSQQIDRVAAELQTFLGSSQIPSFAPHAQKLQSVRRRIAVTNGTLQQVQARLTRLDRLAERLQAREHSSGLRPPPAPQLPGASAELVG
mmetsp:Transcript_6631/g.13287  ORF Transcript_6631/g.13287 Transcript_6631/m.13287 type:complete len:148 (+) Transcript_6631:62-505(+)